MITKAELPQFLLDACPTFAGAWNEFVDEWKDEPELPLYLAISAYARHVIELLTKNDTRQLAKIFAMVERIHTDGDAYVKETATVGLLEDLQNTNLHKSTTPDQFCPYLGPDSKKWWDKLYQFWEEGKVLTDD